MKVTVTGGGGSIGSEICRRLASRGDSVTILSHSEASLYAITRELASYVSTAANLRAVLGSVTDWAAVEDAIPSGTDIVIHAAAHKHIPLCEASPCEAITNNVRGSMIVAKIAEYRGAKLVNISTDKAVRPVSVMGRTKRVAELFVLGQSDKHAVVRFGNVLGSSGSVLPLWEAQTKAGGPITVTDRRCMRYFMDTKDACHLALSAAELPGGLYVLDMGELANIGAMADAFSQQHSDVAIIETGLRQGEKIVEELNTDGEVLYQTPIDRVRRHAGDNPAISVIRINAMLEAARSGNAADALQMLKDLTT